MLVSNNTERVSKVRFWATQARDPTRHYQHSELGYNYRMSNISAGIGRGQLKILSKRIERKREIFEFYKRELAEISDLEMMPVNHWNRPNFWLSCLSLRGKVRPIDIIERLEAENIESRPIWKPMHMQPYYRGYEFEGTGVSEKIYENGVCLPSDTKMSLNEMERTVKIIKSLWKK